MLLSPEDGVNTATEDDVIDSLQLRHTSILSILTNRLHSIQAIAEVWDEYNIQRSVEVLTMGCRDPAVWVDILRVLNVRPKLISLDVAILLMPILNELLFEVYEE
jgi:katanin p80 WD40 repeat-containing subunit B1